MDRQSNKITVLHFKLPRFQSRNSIKKRSLQKSMQMWTAIMLDYRLNQEGGRE